MTNTYTFSITVDSPTKLTKPQRDKLLVHLEDQLLQRDHGDLELYDSEHCIEEED